jgi:hypothetical protein
MKREIKTIIKDVLQHIGMDSEDARALVFRTGMAETGYRALKGYGGNPALGFFQCEPDTIVDIIDNYVLYRPELKIKLYALGLDETNIDVRFMSNIALQVAFCRIKYRRDKEKIPSAEDIIAQAKYWKRVYNTELGKGTIGHFMNANKE